MISKNNMVEIKKCNQCGFTWVARIENPRMCPKCKTYSWNLFKIKKVKQNENRKI